MFSGNELGALLGWWMFHCWKEQTPHAGAVKNVYMLASTVSSKILRAIALKEGFHFEVTDTHLKKAIFFGHGLSLGKTGFIWRHFQIGNTDRVQMDGKQSLGPFGSRQDCSVCL